MDQIDILTIIVIVNIFVTAGVASMTIYSIYSAEKTSAAGAAQTRVAIYHRLDMITNKTNNLLSQLQSVQTFDTAVLKALTNATISNLNATSHIEKENQHVTIRTRT